MIPDEERFYQLSAFFKLIWSVVLPAQAFLPHCPVETLDIGLLVLTIGSGDAVAVTEGWDSSQEIGLEFRPTVSLDKVDMVIKAPCHTLFKEAQAIQGGEFRRQEDVCFPGIDVDGCKGKKTAEID